MGMDDDVRTWVSIVAAVVAVVAALLSWRSSRIARAGLELAKDKEAKALERSNVVWRPTGSSVTGWSVVNIGSDTALDVRLTVVVNGRPFVANAKTVAPKELLTIHLPEVENWYEKQTDRYHEDPHGDFPDVPEVEWTVEWKTPLGSPKIAQGVDDYADASSKLKSNP
jgi:hypothetical protein